MVYMGKMGSINIRKATHSFSCCWLGMVVVVTSFIIGFFFGCCTVRQQFLLLSRGDLLVTKRVLSFSCFPAHLAFGNPMVLIMIFALAISVSFKWWLQTCFVGIITWPVIAWWWWEPTSQRNQVECSTSQTFLNCYKPNLYFQLAWYQSPFRLSALLFDGMHFLSLHRNPLMVPDKMIVSLKNEFNCRGVVLTRLMFLHLSCRSPTIIL